MEPTTAFYIGSAIVRGIALNRAGKMAKQQAALESRRIQEQAKFRQLQALQEHNEIMRGLETFKNTNSALEGVMNRSDRSLDAIRKKAESDTNKVAGRATLQNLADQAKYSSQSQMALLRGRNRASMYRMNAMANFMSTAYGASRLQSGTPTTDVRFDMGKIT